MRNLTLFFFVLFAVSCVEKVIEKPENLISKEKMTAILYDIAVYEAAEATNKSLVDSKNIDMMQLVYQTYNIDSTSFVESDLYYASIPPEYQSIYEAVEERIENDRAALEKKRGERNDSIRNSQQLRKRADSLKKLEKIKKASENLP